jgi:hypothetical protein
MLVEKAGHPAGKPPVLSEHHAAVVLARRAEFDEQLAEAGVQLVVSLDVVDVDEAGLLFDKDVAQGAAEVPGGTRPSGSSKS